MLKKEVIDAALDKVLADENLTLAAALSIAEKEYGETHYRYQLHYGRFITTVGGIYAIDRKDCYTELTRRFVEFLRTDNLLAEPVATGAASTTVYKPDEFDFTDWDAIRRASGF